MQDSDIAYIKAMLWGIFGVCQGSELPDLMFWIAMLYILFMVQNLYFTNIKKMVSNIGNLCNQ